MSQLVGYALALAIGVTLGMLGGGGSILTVPVFVYVMGFEAKDAIAMSLPVVGTTSLVGAVGHWRAGNLDWRAVTAFAPLAMLGALGGARLASLVSGTFQLVLLAAVMIAAGLLMLRDSRRLADDGHSLPPAGAARRLVLGGTGLAVGVLTGLVGVGGGFLIVPALVLLAGVPIRRAVGASLVVISLSTLTGLAAHHRQATISWDVVALFTMLAIVGTVGGTRAARHVAPEALRRAFGVLVLVLAALILFQNRAAAAQQNPPGTVLLVPARVFDGIAARPHEGWGVLIRGDRIEAAGPRGQLRAPADAVTIELPGATLLPGLIDAHSHLLLHPYDEASWDDQVLREPLALRVARATNHARATLMAGFTTVRDLGAEGAGYADVGLKQAIDQGIIPGPRVLATTKAIVATGSYGPKGFDPDFRVPQGAEEADGIDGLTRAVRDQIGKVPTGSKYTPTTAGGRRAEPRTFSEQSAKRARASGHAL